MLLIFSVNSNFLIIAAFAACMVIFVFPLFLLGTVTPSLAKYSVGNLEESGKVVGTLGAFNTIGSIIGTFVPTFVTIPSVGTSITFLIFAGILLVLAVAYFVSAGRASAGGGGRGGSGKAGDEGPGSRAGKSADSADAAVGRLGEGDEGPESGSCAAGRSGEGSEGPESVSRTGEGGKEKEPASGMGKAVTACLCYILCCVLGYSDSFAFWENNLAYEGESVYNYLQVDRKSVV